MARTRLLSLTLSIAVVACVASGLTLQMGVTVAAAEGTATFTRETFKDYESQLAAGRIKAVTVNKRLRSLRVTLEDASHVLAKYTAHEEASVVSALEAKGVPVTVLEPAAAVREATAKPVHHKLRYIAGGLLALVIALVAAVLLVDRRRKLTRLAETGTTSSTSGRLGSRSRH